LRNCSSSPGFVVRETVRSKLGGVRKPAPSEHFRETWYPDLFERGSYTDWEKKGSQTLLERASARVEKLLAEHHPEPLPEDVKAKLRKIVERAEKK
jgi:trimethylamine:corrinoid methyltransferase-like protein